MFLPLFIQELLALDEKIGYVSTGLSEETISKCLEKILYSSETEYASQSMDIEVKCNIFQVFIISMGRLSKNEAGLEFKICL